jgi:short-subunit dehydrogenase
MPTALVTGATSGIGRALATAIARRGLDLVVVARDSDRLAAVAGELAGRYGVAVEQLPADLTDPEQRGSVEKRLVDADSPIDLLVNNAGYGTVGRFWEAPLGGEQGQVDLHVTTTLRLTHAVLPGMVARGRGAIVNVASVAGLVPGASGPTYGATKAFQVFFSEALAPSLRPYGVTVMALCPGFTRTEFHERGRMDVTRLPAFAWLDADDVAEAALRDLDRGRVVSVPSRRYRWLITASGLVPRGLGRAVAGAVGRRRRPGAAQREA